jgi:hypothetical protein
MKGLRKETGGDLPLLKDLMTAFIGAQPCH